MDINDDQLQVIAHPSSVVYAVDDNQVLKEYYDVDMNIETERKALRGLGHHPKIIRYLGDASPKSILLQRGTPILNEYSSIPADQIPLQRRLAWIKDAACGIQHIHQNHIIHADIGCENMVLVADRLQIIDFEGCGIDGGESLSAYKWYNRKGLQVNTESDIFAFGCAVYQLLTGRRPYESLAESENCAAQVQELYTLGQFPDTHHLPLHRIMQGCWDGTLGSIDEVLSGLDRDWQPQDQPEHILSTALALLQGLVNALSMWWQKTRGK